tara:strand:- start:8829 stop:9176 length:348 start_codon:yes stop_codon:yes gene_type:complete
MSIGKDLLLIGVSGYIGWYLAMNESKQVLSLLETAKQEGLKLKDKLAKEIESNEKLSSLLNGMQVRSKNNLEALNGIDGSYELDEGKLKSLVKEGISVKDLNRANKLSRHLAKRL